MKVNIYIFWGSGDLSKTWFIYMYLYIRSCFSDITVTREMVFINGESVPVVQKEKFVVAGQEVQLAVCVPDDPTPTSTPDKDKNVELQKTPDGPKLMGTACTFYSKGKPHCSLFSIFRLYIRYIYTNVYIISLIFQVPRKQWHWMTSLPCQKQSQLRLKRSPSRLLSFTPARSLWFT